MFNLRILDSIYGKVDGQEIILRIFVDLCLQFRSVEFEQTGLLIYNRVCMCHSESLFNAVYEEPR